MVGRVVVVTGGSDGLGLSAAEELGRRGWCVVLACRNVGKAEVARGEIKNACQGSAEVHIVPFDAAEDLTTTIPQCVQQIEACIKPRRVDVLLCNAGVGGRFPFRAREVSPNGIETVFQVNFLSHHYLTQQLLASKLFTASLNSNADCRVINVSSVMHRAVSKPALIAKYARRDDSNSNYSRSKLAQLLATFAFAGRQSNPSQSDPRSTLPSPIKYIALHPGAVASSIWRNDISGAHLAAKPNKTSSLFEKVTQMVFVFKERMINTLLQRFFLPPHVAARSLVDACADPQWSVRASGPGPLYLTPGWHEPTGFGVQWIGMRSTTPSLIAKDPKAAEDLWELAEELKPDLLRGTN